MKLRAVLGCFALLGRRSRVVGQPGLTVYSEAGTSSAQELGAVVRDLSHRNECAEGDLATRLKRITADGKVDRAEFAELAGMPPTLERCADRSHEIGETVKL